MKAKINTLIVLSAIFVATLVSGLLAGCGEVNPKDEANKLGMTACVTYYTNGGSFATGSDSPDDKYYRTDYYKPGTPIFDIDEKSSIFITRAGYSFLGWEYAVLDENGLPILYALDKNGNKTDTRLEVLENGTPSIKGDTGRELLEQEKRFEAVPSGEKVFANGQHPRVGDGEHVYLVATWKQNVLLEYKLVSDTPITVVENEQSVTYNNGDIISTGIFTSDSINPRPNEAPKKFDGFSYINLYWDEECKKPVKDNERVQKIDDETNSVIYAKYLSGSWTPVRDKSKAAEMLSATGNRNYYVVYDIDCSGTSFSYKTGSFGGVIEGNGYTLSNISIKANVQNGGTASILGRLTATAKVRDLNIENVTIDLSVGISMTMYVLVTSVDSGAVLENVTLNTVTLKIKKPDNATIQNIKKNTISGEYTTDHWLYGAYSTDEEFESAYNSVKVKNATLIIMMLDGKEELNITVNKEITNQEDSNE